MNLALELTYPDGKIVSVDRLVSVMTFQQYCSTPLGLFQTLNCADVSTAVYIDKSQVAVHVYRYLATIGCAASELPDGAGLIQVVPLLENLHGLRIQSIVEPDVCRDASSITIADWVGHQSRPSYLLCDASRGWRNIRMSWMLL